MNMSLYWNNALVIGKSFGIILAFACVSDFINNSMQFCFWFERLGYGSGPFTMSVRWTLNCRIESWVQMYEYVDAIVQYEAKCSGLQLVLNLE